MKRLRSAAIALLMVLASSGMVFADIIDPIEEAKHNLLLPILLITVAVIVIILVVRSRKRRQ